MLPIAQSKGVNPLPRSFPPRPTWQRQQNHVGQGELVCDYCAQAGHRIGPMCELWCKHWEERGRPVIRFQEAGRGQRPPPCNVQQVPQANMVLIELASDQEESYNVSPGHKEASTKGDFQVCNVSHSLQMKCDCSSCIQIECCEEIESLAVKSQR